MSDTQGDDEIAPNATVYVRNIEERIKIPVLIEALRGIFAEFGTIQEIIAKKSIKRKGQAFVVFEEIESAQNAIDTLQDFEIFGKQLSLEFAKTRSDITVKNEDGDEAFEAHKKQRIAEKERKQAQEAAVAAETKTKKRALETEETAERPAKLAKMANVLNADVPDEYLPPNKNLAIRELPAEVTKDDLLATFSVYPGFVELRVVPHRLVAFIEFKDIETATVAKNANANLVIKDKPIRITFRRS